MEEFTEKEAAAYLKAPKKGRGYQPLLRPCRATEEPRAKKPRPMVAPESRGTDGMVILEKP
jgi:hypothetical protein